MRHIVNFGLLFAFATLAVTGGMAFLQPFSLITTRVHILFGVATVLLVACHLASRLAYFRNQLLPKKQSQISRPALAVIVIAWAGLLAAAISGWPPTKSVVELGYEARHRAEIVRSSSLAGFADARHHRQIVRTAGPEADVAVSLFIGFAKNFADDSQETPTIAVWAESSTGSMIETLYLDPRLAYAESPQWGGAATPRNHILPIWRHRYTLISGVEPSGELDTITQPTPTHQFTLDNYLQLGQKKEFVICVEVNLPGDVNKSYRDQKIGQPSLLYTAYIEVDSPQRYALLELTGHGGGAEKNGAIQYDLDQITSARRLIDLLLVKVERPNNDTSR